MKWTTEHHPKDHKNPRTWFAWRPVHLYSYDRPNKEYRWLERVERQWCGHRYDGHWEYKELKKENDGEKNSGYVIIKENVNE